MLSAISCLLLALIPILSWPSSNGVIQGFRIGFNQARGTLSGTINSFSGNLG